MRSRYCRTDTRLLAQACRLCPNRLGACARPSVERVRHRLLGARIDIAEKMGLLPGLLREGYHVRELRIVDRHGKRVSGFGTKVFDELSAGQFVSIRRSDLSRLIFSKIADDCEVLFGDTIKAIDQEEDGTRVTFESGKERRFDLVIGADGLHSVRGIVFGPQEKYEKHLGYTVAAFEVASYRPRDEDVYVIYEQPGRQVGRFSLHGDRTLFLFVLAHDLDRRSYPNVVGAQRSFLRNAFANDEWELPQILARLDSCAELYFDRVSQIRMDTWSRGQVGLIGDAAFCVSLLAGQGSALAMTAAYVLAEELDKSKGDYNMAFRRYEELLRPYVIGKQNAAVRFASFFAPRTRLGLPFSPPCHECVPDTDDRYRPRSGCRPTQIVSIYFLRLAACL